MGGKTFDQFKSRQQARIRKTHDPKESSPKSKESDPDYLVKKNPEGD